MSRFYRGDDCVIDLEAVSAVIGDAVFINGVRVPVREPVASAIRKQFVLYKENRDKKYFELRTVFAQNMGIIAWASNMLGSRLFQLSKAREQKAVEVVQ